jgi:hypothetical protein
MIERLLQGHCKIAVRLLECGCKITINITHCVISQGQFQIAFFRKESHGNMVGIFEHRAAQNMIAITQTQGKVRLDNCKNVKCKKRRIQVKMTNARPEIKKRAWGIRKVA